MHETTHERLPQSERIPTGGAGTEQKKLIWASALLVFVIGMVAFAYANAELFAALCQRVGILPADVEMAEGVTPMEKGRPLDVYFSANVNDGLPITLSVVNRFQKTNVGVAKLNDYRFTNLSDRTIYFRPVHDIFPIEAGTSDILLLTKCFCFDLQKIEPHQTYTLPVEYTFTDKLDEKVRTIRMDYTLFPSSKEAYEEFQKAAEAGNEKLPKSGDEFLKEKLDK